MFFKTVSTLVMTEGPDALDAAISCASRWSAHLNVTCVAHGSVSPDAFAYPEMGIAETVMNHGIAEALSEAETRTRSTLAAQDFGWSVTGIADTGADSIRALASAERFSDLMVLPSPRVAADADKMISGVLDNGQLPILVAPDVAKGGDFQASFDRVMIAWDESDVALAAVRAAMPLLHHAAQIEIVSIDPDNSTTGNDLAVMLDRHGIDADVTAVARGGKSISEAIMDHARETGADLIVMGAYGHRRLRDVFLGGVTRQMLNKCSQPMLIAR